MTQIEEADKFLDNYDGESAYNLLIESVKTCSGDAALFWRLAHACYILSNQEEDSTKRLELLKEGRAFTLQALEIEPQNAVVLKWAATLTGALAEHSGLREKITLGNEFKNFMDKALELDPDEPTLLHMRGRFKYQVASLSMVERTVASVLFETLPSVNYEDALQDLMKMEDIAPGDLDNLLFIGKCYYQMGKNAEAKEWLQKLVEAVAVDSIDAEHIAEASEILAKIDPTFVASR